MLTQTDVLFHDEELLHRAIRNASIESVAVFDAIHAINEDCSHVLIFAGLVNVVKFFWGAIPIRREPPPLATG